MLVHWGCGGGRRGSRSDSRANPLIRAGEHQDGTDHPTAQTVVNPETIREYFFPRKGRKVKPKYCSEMNRAKWTQEWKQTCQRIQQEKELIRWRDKHETNPIFPHLYEPGKEDIHPVENGSLEPRERYSLELIHSGPAVTVFRGINERKDSAIFKYQLNCGQMKRNHDCDSFWASRNYFDSAPTCFIQVDEDPLLSEYVFTKIVSESSSDQLSPKVFTLSSPVAVPEDINPKTNIKTYFAIGPQVCRSFNSSIRLVVEEEIGSTLNKCLKGLYTLSAREIVVFATNAFIRIISLLRQLHRLGIIHGDIHAGNMGFATGFYPLGSPHKLLLIDFGYAEFFPGDIGKKFYVAPGLYWNMNPQFLSSFELAGYRKGRRDDVYRAFELFINMLTRGALRKIFSTINGQYKHREAHEEMGSLKSGLLLSSSQADRGRYHSIFEDEDFNSHVANAVNAYRGIGDILGEFQSSQNVELTFVQMEEYVSGSSESKPLSSPDSEPDYDWLIEKAEHILANLS